MQLIEKEQRDCATTAKSNERRSSELVLLELSLILEQLDHNLLFPSVGLFTPFPLLKKKKKEEIK